MFIFSTLRHYTKINSKRRFFILIVFFSVILLNILSELIPRIATILKTQKVWKFTTESSISSNFARSALSPITIDDTQIYVGDRDGHVYALDKQRGTINWQFRTHNYTPYPIESSDPQLIFVADFDGRIYALEKSTGQEKWRFAIPDLVQPDTELILYDDYLFFGGRDGVLYTLEKSTGQLKWQSKLVERDMTTFEKNRPVIHFGLIHRFGDRLLVNAANGTLIMFEAKSGREVWRYVYNNYVHEIPQISGGIVLLKVSDTRLIALNINDGKMKWDVTLEHPIQGPVIPDVNQFYINTTQGNLYAYDRTSGKLIWNYVTSEFIQSPPYRTSEQLLVPSLVERRLGRIMVFTPTGKKLWQFEAPGELNHILPIGKITIVGGEAGVIYFIEPDGRSSHQISLRGAVKDGFLRIKECDLISTTDSTKTINLYCLDDKNISLKWGVHDVDMDWSTITIDGDSIYFLNGEKKSLYAIKKISQLDEKYQHLIQVQRRPPPNPRILRKIVEWLEAYNVKRNLIWQKITLFPSVESLEVKYTGNVKKNQVFELTLTHGDRNYTNVWEEVSVTADFKDRTGITFKTAGFYYDQNIWKVRFAPPTPGKWKWEVQFKTELITHNRRGDFLVEESTEAGFLRINPQNPYRFTFDNGSPFFPIGFQDAIYDYDFNGNPLDQWGSIDNTPIETDLIKMADMETYFHVYRNQGNGFNLYRWGVDNASFRLWDDISATPSATRYGINEGIWGDSLVQELRVQGFRVMMSIFGFSPPFPYTISESRNASAIHKYIDYVVARYGAYVDIWELMNEAHVDDEWIRVVSTYLRSIDPYKHPVTTNWERADMEVVDLSSLHWYEKEPSSDIDSLTVKMINISKKWQKPIIFSEVGNKVANWDSDSALRLRVKAWTAFFNEATLIFWNQTRDLYHNKDNANIYLGPEELSYISTLQKFVHDVDKDIKPTELIFNDFDIRTYGLKSNKFFLAYFYHFRNQQQSVATSFTIDLPYNGTLVWLGPKTGKVIKEFRVGAGNQIFTTPLFDEDLAMKIIFKE